MLFIMRREVIFDFLKFLQICSPGKMSCLITLTDTN